MFNQIYSSILLGIVAFFTHSHHFGLIVQPPQPPFMLVILDHLCSITNNTSTPLLPTLSKEYTTIFYCEFPHLLVSATDCGNHFHSGPLVNERDVIVFIVVDVIAILPLAVACAFNRTFPGPPRCPLIPPPPPPDDCPPPPPSCHLTTSSFSSLSGQV